MEKISLILSLFFCMVLSAQAKEVVITSTVVTRTEIKPQVVIQPKTVVVYNDDGELYHRRRTTSRYYDYDVIPLSPTDRDLWLYDYGYRRGYRHGRRYYY